MIALVLFSNIYIFKKGLLSTLSAPSIRLNHVKIKHLSDERVFVVDLPTLVLITALT